MKKKFNYIKLIVFIGCIATVMSMVSCTKDNDSGAPAAGNQSLDEMIKQDTSLTIFNAILKKTHLDIYSTGPGPFTVMAPNNNAYRQNGINSLADVANFDSVLLLSRSSFLISAGVKSSYYLVGLNVPITTIAGTTISATALSDATYFNGFKAYKPDLMASNGVLHVMNDYILPNLTSTSATLLLFPTTYKLFSQAVARASSGTTIVNATTTTVFAPTNDAMLAAGYDSVKISKTTAADLATLVKYHTLSTKYYVFALQTGDVKTTLGKNVTLNMGTAVPTVKGLANALPAKFTNFYLQPATPLSSFSSVNLSTLNGVVHTIDQVLKPN